jgi:TM2 domain-containing membrane protein YozV
MYCRVCGKEINQNAFACTTCGCDPRKGKKFCFNCGSETNAEQIICLKCGVELKNRTLSNNENKDKTIAALLAIFLGCLGIHQFYLGNNISGVIRLTITLITSILTFGFSVIILSIIGFIEGIIYLTKTEEEFKSIYIEGHKSWF